MSSLVFGMASNGSVEIDDMINTSFQTLRKPSRDWVQKLNSFKNLKPVIAIDGTAGSGKGTLAKLANFINLTTLTLEFCTEFVH